MSKFNSMIARRDFLKAAGLGVAGLAANPILGLSQAQASANSDHTLIYIFLRGGTDALSMLPPTYTDLRRVYRENRQDIAFEAYLLPTPHGGNYAFGINRSLPDLKQLWDDGDLSVIHGMGSLTNTVSHFDQMAYIEGGSHQQRLAEGFFQRLKRNAGWQSNLALAAVEPSLPRSMMGTGFVLQYGTAADLSRLPSGLAAPGLSRGERLSRNYRGLATINRTATALSSLSEDLSARLERTPAPDASQIPLEQIREITRLMCQNGERPKVITTSLSGWDFHSNLSSRFVASASESGAPALSKSLRGMAQILKNVNGQNIWSKMTIVVMSEFGRRIVENGADGADHGRGGIGLVLGGRILPRRMLYSTDYVSRLISLYGDARRAQAQIPVGFDYRLILAEVIQKRFGLSNSSVFGSESAVFPENIDGTASTLKLDVADPLSSAVHSSYRGNEARQRVASLIIG